MLFDYYHTVLSDGPGAYSPQALFFSVPVSVVQVEVGSAYCPGESVTLTAYDHWYGVLDSASVVLDGTLQQVSVSAVDIGFVEVATTAGLFVLDNLQFANSFSADLRPPLLKIAQEANMVALSWPSYSEGFWLEERDANSVWRKIDVAPVIQGPEQKALVEQTNAFRFYRLKRCPCPPRPPKP